MRVWFISRERGGWKAGGLPAEAIDGDVPVVRRTEVGGALRRQRVRAGARHKSLRERLEGIFWFK